MSSISLQLLAKHRLVLSLTPIFVAQLALTESLQDPAYAYHNGQFTSVLAPNEGITEEFIKKYVLTHSLEIFISDRDKKELQDKLSDKITRMSRSMSSGDLAKKMSKQAHLLSMQMNNLYQNPYSDELLNNQIQSAKNFAAMLLSQKTLHTGLFAMIKKQNHHYTIKQPLLSSILMLSFMQYTGSFTEKEIENFFVTSYLKDIGLCFIPREKFDLAILNDDEKQLFSEHSKNSMQILTGRGGLGQQQLKMIEHHHFLNYVVKAKASNAPITSLDLPISGIESVIMSAMDILVAMTTDRPYRTSHSVFKGLEFLKIIISDDYPQEFKLMVLFIKNFFSR